MNVRQLQALLAEQAPDAIVHIYTGWEGLDDIDVGGVRAYPDGYLTPGPAAVCVYASGHDPGDDANPASPR